MVEKVLALHALMLALVWVPFAVAGGLIDTWHSEGGRRFRAQFVHPVRTWRLTHAGAPA